MTDEELLEMVTLRAVGVSPSEIARRFYTDAKHVREQTDNVMIADLRESGEPIFEVAKHYWSRR